LGVATVSQKVRPAGLTKQYTCNSVANSTWKEPNHACAIDNDRVWSRDDNVKESLRQMIQIARLDYMANENKLYVIRPRKNSISNCLDTRFCRRYIFLFVWCTVEHISTGV